MSELLSFEVSIKENWPGRRVAVTLGDVEVSSCQINDFWTEDRAREEAIRNIARHLADLVGGEYVSYQR